jgi:predicted DNA-binding ribbon-helix-helix protein
MKRITIDINDAEYERLKQIATDHESTVAQLLGAFVQDLTDSDRRGGSDEHLKAWEWLDRTWLKFR